MPNTTAHERSELLSDIEDWHSGVMSEADAVRFKELLRNDVHACQIFIEYGDMLTHLSLEADIAAANAVDVRIADALGGSQTASIFSRHRFGAMIALTCACTLAFGVLYFSRKSGPAAVAVAPRSVVAEQPPAAIITEVVSRVGGPANVLVLGTRLQSNEVLVLDNEQQFVELSFSSSAQLVVQGPARLVVETGNSARLDSGRVVGVVPPAAVGFLLKVPNGEVRDLGTEFAVDARQTETDVAVLTGVVDCKLQSAERKPARATLSGQEQLRMDFQSAALISLDARPESLDRIIVFHNGIAGISGSAQWLQQIPPLASEADRYPSSLAQIYLERQKLHVEWNEDRSEILLATADPGDKSRKTTRIRPEVTFKSQRPAEANAGLADCYFIRLKTPTKRTLKISGSVTFREEIIAALTAAETLNATDEFVSRPDFTADWKANPSKSRGSNDPEDVVNISPDGKTVNFTLQSSAASDELRILVRHRDRTAR